MKSLTHWTCLMNDDSDETDEGYDTWNHCCPSASTFIKWWKRLNQKVSNFQPWLSTILWHQVKFRALASLSPVIQLRAWSLWSPGCFCDIMTMRAKSRRRRQSSLPCIFKDAACPGCRKHFPLPPVSTHPIHWRRTEKYIFFTFSYYMNLIPYALQGQDAIQGRPTFRKLTALYVKPLSEWQYGEGKRI